MIVFGYDPGGNEKSGVALVGSGFAATDTLTGVDSCLEWLAGQLGVRALNAAGIDAPLSWATNATGLRRMDEYLRRRYRKVKSSVLATNSMYGSAAVQGPAMAIRLRERWPDLEVNETHPKVLFHALIGRAWSHAVDAWLREEAGARVEIRNDHEADALLSAIVTQRCLTGDWGCADLMDRATGKTLRPCGTVRYLWPVGAPAPRSWRRWEEP